MKIIKYALGQLQANCYFLIEKNNCLIIDPADEANFILEKIQRERLNLVALCATHGHFDHLLAAGEIQQSLNVPLYINEKDLFLLKRLKQNAQYFLGYQPPILPISNIKKLDEGLLEIETFKLKTIFTPGHTPGSACFYLKEGVLFSGDTLFKGGIGRYDFSYSDKNKLQQSLKKILQYRPETKIFPGHGDETTIGEEKTFIFKNFII
jgi:glyoxylase-like metal-dependent hydrolase (beta-lactamase superfamily II)